MTENQAQTPISRQATTSSERDSDVAPDWLSGNNNNAFVHELEISDNGDWVDNVYKASKPSSLSAWLRRRRAWSPSSDRSIFTSADILCRGYLEKLGSWRRNWKTRYFILRSDTHSLCYFNNHVEMVLLGEVVISTNSEVWRGTKLGEEPEGSVRKVSNASNSDQDAGLQSSTSSASSGLTFGVTCSTTQHTLIMEAPDAVSLGVWLQAIQEEVQAARDNALNGSCNSLNKSTPASAHSESIDALLSAFAGSEIPRLECVGFQDLPVSMDSEREGEVGTMTTAQGKEQERSLPPKSPRRGSSMLNIFGGKRQNSNDKTPGRHVVKKKQESAKPSEPLPTPPPSRNDGSDDEEEEDLLEQRAETKISESFSPKANPDSPNGYSNGIPDRIPHTPNPSPYGTHNNSSIRIPNSANTTTPGGSTRPRNKFTANCSVGLQLSVQLSGVCDSSDSLFVVAFGGKLTPQGSVALEKHRREQETLKSSEGSSSPKGPSSPRTRASVAQAIDLSHVSWVQLGRTETVKQRDAGSIVSRTTSKAPASGLSGIPPASAALVCRQFSLMINDPARLGVEVLMFAVYKSNGTNEELASHNELAWGTVDSNYLVPDEYCRLALNSIHSKQSSMAAFQEMNTDLNLRLPSEVFNGPEPVAYIGICYTTSVPLTRRVYTSAHRLSFKTPPYSHKIYGFQSLTGRVLTREELHLPRYSLSVPAALLSLLLEERLPSVEKLLKVVVSELMIATKQLHSLQKESSSGGARGKSSSMDKKLKRQASSSGQIIDVMDDQISSASKLASEIERAESRVMTLKRGEEVLKDVRGSLLGTYLSCYNYCIDSLNEEEMSFEIERASTKGRDNSTPGSKKNAKPQRQSTPSVVTMAIRQQMGVPLHMGGARLKRSIMKKSEVLAFIPTNLNVQLLHTEPGYRNRSEGNLAEEDAGDPTDKNGTSPAQKLQFTSLASLIETEANPTPKQSKRKVAAQAVGQVVGTAVGAGLVVGEAVGQAVGQAVGLAPTTPVAQKPQAQGSPSSPPDLRETRSTLEPHHLTGAQKERTLDDYMFKGPNPPSQVNATSGAKDSTAGGGATIDTFSSLTFGVCAAHSMSKSGGGLRRLLLSSGTDGVFRADTEAWNVRSEGNYHKNMLEADPLKSSLEVDMSTSRAAQMCALHGKGVEMTVADLRSHAGGTRRNSILKIAATSRSYGGKDSSDNIDDLANEVEETKKGKKEVGAKEEEEEGAEEKMKLTGDVEDWLKCAMLMKRVDIVTSQVLSVAISGFQTTLSMAAAGSPHHVSILPNILEAGFLCSFESLLSAYGGELCMLEDLCVAVEWLSTVTFRIVERKKKRGKDPERESEGGFDVKNPKGYGYADGVWIRRSRTSGSETSESMGESFSSRDTGAAQESSIAGIKWGELVVDLEVNSSTAQAVREAKWVMGKKGGVAPKDTATSAVTSSAREGGGRWKKLTRRASSPLMSSEEKLAAQQNAVGLEGGGEKLTGLEKIFERTEIEGSKKGSPKEDEQKGEGEKSPTKGSEWGDSDMGVLATVGVSAVLFTQGINAQQTLANNKIGGDSSVQVSINRTSMHRLKSYYACFKAAAGKERLSRTSLVSPGGQKGSIASQRPSSGMLGAGSKPTSSSSSTASAASALDFLFNKAQACVNSSCVYGNEKNVNVLLKTSDLCRAMNGTHAILCKSGKDRTSMAVTLEQARYLCSTHGVVSGKKSAEIMRRHGVRRHNVWSNTGQRNFAFNGINYTSLPKCFRPPAGCYSGSVNT